MLSDPRVLYRDGKQPQRSTLLQGVLERFERAAPNLA
jgi:hypothetical protein